MAYPKLLQKLFQNGGAGPLLRSDILPIKTVNGKEPDSSGNIDVPTYTHPSTHPASMITGLATVATSGSYNDLSNKPTIPATPKAYVTETWVNGTDWYRKWSDGWCEQGGGPRGNGTQTLHVPYRDANWTCVTGQIGGDGTTRIHSKTTTTFYQGGYRVSCSSQWVAMGYMW